MPKRPEPSTPQAGSRSPVEQMVSRMLKPLGLVVLSRERIQQTLDEAAERGRLTRSDANALAGELVRRGRQQTEDFLTELDRIFGLGRQQLDAATRAARRTVGLGSSFPIADYDELTAAQVQSRLDGLSPAQLRTIRDYERSHANRKSVIAAVDKARR